MTDANEVHGTFPSVSQKDVALRTLVKEFDDCNAALVENNPGLDVALPDTPGVALARAALAGEVPVASNGLHEALTEIEDALTCKDDGDVAHYCPNCDNSLYRVREKVRTLLAQMPLLSGRSERVQCKQCGASYQRAEQPWCPDCGSDKIVTPEENVAGDSGAECYGVIRDGRGVVVAFGERESADTYATNNGGRVALLREVTAPESLGVGDSR